LEIAPPFDAPHGDKMTYLTRADTIAKEDDSLKSVDDVEIEDEITKAKFMVGCTLCCDFLTVLIESIGDLRSSFNREARESGLERHVKDYRCSGASYIEVLCEKGSRNNTASCL
jgi:hypothetical protein